jgi:antitoxin PrlF
VITSRLTSKAQTTIPQPVRKALDLAPGDALAYELAEGRAILRKHRPGGPAGLGILQEWSHPANEIFDRI